MEITDLVPAHHDWTGRIDHRVEMRDALIQRLRGEEQLEVEPSSNTPSAARFIIGRTAFTSSAFASGRLFVAKSGNETYEMISPLRSSSFSARATPARPASVA